MTEADDEVLELARGPGRLSGARVEALVASLREGGEELGSPLRWRRYPAGPQEGFDAGGAVDFEHPLDATDPARGLAQLGPDLVTVELPLDGAPGGPASALLVLTGLRLAEGRSWKAELEVLSGSAAGWPERLAPALEACAATAEEEPG